MSTTPLINWTLLNLWSLGWGTPSISFTSTIPIPSPDALVSILTIIWLQLFIYNQKGKQYHVRHSDDYMKNAGNYEILPLFFPLLRILMKGLSLLFLCSIVLYILLYYGTPFTILYQLIIQYIFNIFRIFSLELITHTITFFFLQSSLSYSALYRALIPAGIWSCIYTIINLVLMIVYVHKDITTDDGDIPRYIITGLNLFIVIVYFVII